jgi:hypothetical protein
MIDLLILIAIGLVGRFVGSMIDLGFDDALVFP